MTKTQDAIRKALKAHGVKPFIQPSAVLAKAISGKGDKRELFAKQCKKMGIGPVKPLWKSFKAELG